MKTCPSCGGKLGRDCFNPIECAWITQSINDQYIVDSYKEELDRKAEKEYWDMAERQHNEILEAEYIDSVSESMMKSNNVFKRFLLIN